MIQTNTSFRKTGSNTYTESVFGQTKSYFGWEKTELEAGLSGFELSLVHIANIALYVSDYWPRCSNVPQGIFGKPWGIIEIPVITSIRNAVNQFQMRFSGRAINYTTVIQLWTNEWYIETKQNLRFSSPVSMRYYSQQVNSFKSFWYVVNEVNFGSTHKFRFLPHRNRCAI